MLGVIDALLVCVFVFFYVGLFYNVPILAAGVWDFKRYSKRLANKISLDRKSLPFFSIILPVKNEKTVIKRALTGVSKLKYPSDRFEVIIVDDGSDDGTLGICEEFVGSCVNFRFYHRDVSEGKASALNFGFKKSKGDIIAVFDADNVPALDILGVATAHFMDQSVAALQGRIHSLNSNQNMLTKFNSYEDSVWCEAFLRGKEKLGLFVHLRGCCQFIRRSVLDSVGGFDETTLSEDMEISARLVKEGHRIKYTSELRTWQESPSRLKAFLKQRTRWHRGHMEVAIKYGSLLKKINKITLDAEFTLCFPFVAIASLVCFGLSFFNVFSVLSNNVLLNTLMTFSTITLSAMFLLTGAALIYCSRPTRVKNLLWLPFVLGYWFLQSFLAAYAAFLILFKRPAKWVKTEKTGIVSSKMFTNAFSRNIDADAKL